MYNTILLATALQRWERYSAHALAARELALFIASNASKRLHVLSAYDYGYQRVSELPPEMLNELHKEERQSIDRLMEQKLDEYIAPLKEEGLEVAKILRVGGSRKASSGLIGEVCYDGVSGTVRPHEFFDHTTRPWCRESRLQMRKATWPY
jgi:hypothetical protein